MAIIKIVPEYFQTYELIANPNRTFESSSSGITGSVSLFVESSTSLKDLDLTLSASQLGYSDNALDSLRLNIISGHAPEGPAGQPAGVHHGKGKIFNLEKYMTRVNAHPQGERFGRKQEVLRQTPGPRLDIHHMRKQVIKKNLFSYYKHLYPNLDWAYTNYNCLNFFTSDTVPSDSALIYPAGTGSVADEDLNFYAPSSSFTFDFYLKPKFNSLPSNGNFHAGTILHMSSCYAISLVSGSSKGQDNKPDKFRLLLQLSQSADIPPSSCNLGTTEVTSNTGIDGGFLFASSDNSLHRNRWHHVTIRWPGETINGGSGSIAIDGVKDTEFVIASGAVMQASQSSVVGAPDDPNAVFVGNYYAGPNTGGSAIARFFAPTVAANEGLTAFVGSDDSDPTGISLSHPLRAEIHDIKIFNIAKSDKEVDEFRTKGASLGEGIIFYVPPLFTKETRTRNVIQTPFFETTGKTDDPFNVTLSFGVNGLDINLENFTREFVRNEFPRLYNLSASTISSTVSEEGLTSNDILYSSGSARKRLWTLLPCDNGYFLPNFDLLATGSDLENKFVDAFGSKRYDLVTLEDMVSIAGLPDGLRSLQTLPTRSFNESGVMSVPTTLGPAQDTQYSVGSFLFELEGASPEDPSTDPGSILTILQRTGDPSSNEVVFFNISNLFYGDSIRPGTLTIEDLSVTGSNKEFNLTLKDDGDKNTGNIYRDDTVSTPSKFNSVGHVFYDEGIIVLKSPHLSLFGKDHFKITFEGERKVYVFEISIPLNENLHNSSSNPTYKDLVPSDYSNETAERFTYVTGLQLHDDNLNVVGRAHLSQPFIKRDSDRVVIKLRMDF